MSQQEFENYLALLSRLLRIGPRERDRVAGEFRSHLEDRLDELLARGMPRDEAVRQALEEFGDAAGLAAELVSLNRNRRNRWIMRLTTMSVAAVVLIAAGIVTFWPGNNAGPGRALVVAQDPDKADPNKPGQADPFAPPAGAPAATAAASETLAEKLNVRTDAEFVETPLKDTIEFLADKCNLQIIIKQKRLEEAGVALDQQITLRLKNVRLSTLLDVMLEDLNLVYTEKDDLVVITTPDDAQATMEVRVYDCRDLLTMPTVGMPRPGAPPFGPGSLGPPVGPGFPGGDTGFGEPGGYPGGRAADAPMPGGGFPGGSLPGTEGSAPAGIPGGPAAPGAAAPSAAPQGPRRPRNDVLPQAAGLGGMAPGGMGGSLGGQQPPQRPLTAEELKAEQLLNIITTAVNPDSWAEMGGPGTIGEYNGLVVVSQSARTHSKIEKVLDMLREAANLPKSKDPRVVR